MLIAFVPLLLILKSLLPYTMSYVIMRKYLGFAELSLHDALSHHSLGNLHEAGYISALDIVNIAVGLLAVLHAVLVDILHDSVQAVVNLFRGPAEALRVLAHFET